MLDSTNQIKQKEKIKENINEFRKIEALSNKTNALKRSISLIDDSIDILLEVWRLTPREIEVIFNVTTSKIREHKNYNRSDNLSELVVFLHSDIKDSSEIKKLKERETEDLLNLWVEFGKNQSMKQKSILMKNHTLHLDLIY